MDSSLATEKYRCIVALVWPSLPTLLDVDRCRLVAVVGSHPVGLLLLESSGECI